MKHLSVLIAATLATACLCHATAAGPACEPGAMLRQGTWDGGVGNFEIPQALAATAPTKWPAQGWQRLRLQAGHIDSEPVVTPRSAMPAFLKTITDQIVRAQAADAPGTSPAPTADPAADEAAQSDLYVRVPGVRWVAGKVPVHRFANGTPQLQPRLDHRYELRLGTQPFAVSVRNGLRGRNGEAYGDGAHYTVEYDGAVYRYSLAGYGWDSAIRAIADFDGDGKPDFLISVSGANSGTEFLLLSSKAKPGRNAPTASLHATGC